MPEHVQTVVIGAGVLGLAIARELAPQGPLLILEREDAIGTGTSSRNSEVIHAGMYYAAGTLKARACVEGRRQLYGYCRERGVAHRRTGKLIVATEADQVPALQAIAERARANGPNRPARPPRPTMPCIGLTLNRCARWNPRCAAWAHCGRRPRASSTRTR